MSAENPSPAVERPRGFLQPPTPELQRIARAIRERRLDDAEQLLSLLRSTELHDLAWTHLARCTLEIAQSTMVRAASSALQCAGLALACAYQGDEVSAHSARRMAAQALNLAGTVHRRMDQPASALMLHEAAHNLRIEFGSLEECWETAQEAGLDEEIAGNHENALAWHERALNYASNARNESESMQANCRHRLAVTYSALGNFGKAVREATEALHLLKTSEPSSADVARAQLQLATATVKRAESLLGQQPDVATVQLNDVRGLLEETHVELLAFGGETVCEARRCREMLDFVDMVTSDARHAEQAGTRS